MTPPASRSPAVVATAGALACVVLLAITGVAALLVPAARARDAAALHGFTRLDQTRLESLVSDIAHLADPLPYGVASLALIAVAAWRGRWGLVALLPVLLLGSAVTTRTLKHALAEPRVVDFLGGDQIGAASWPSGHATAAMALALGAVLVAPPRHRPAIALAGAAFAAAVAYSVLVLAWHFPSDVLGGFLVAGAWALGVVAVLARFEREPGPRAPRASWQAAGVLLTLGAAAMLAAVTGAAARHPAAATVALSHPSFVAVAVAVAALAATVTLGVSRAVET